MNYDEVLHFALPAQPVLRVAAVSYLNTLPLVWGFLHGAQRRAVDLSFSVPAECADRLARGDADLGIIPCAELDRIGVATLRDVGIACRGAVRSILLISKVDPSAIKVLAVDTSSRTSIRLARILLQKRYGSRPELRPLPPSLPAMLEEADAALVIGDPALRLDPDSLPYNVLDLGQEWFDTTGLPMVFAVWAGRRELLTEEVRTLFRDSCSYGLEHLPEIVSAAERERGFPAELVKEYFTRRIVFELNEEALRGMELFLKLSRELPY